MNYFRMTTAVLAIVVFSGCTKKPELPPISGWVQYHDPYFQGTFSYPQGWHVVVEGTKVSMYSSQEAVGKFFDPTSKAPEGIQLVASYQKPDTLRSLDEHVNALKDELTVAGFTVESAQPQQVGGLPAIQLTYAGRFDENTKLETIKVFAVRDSLLYSFSYAAFNDLFAPARYVFDTLLTSFRFPAPKVVAANVDPSIPSATFAQFENANLKIAYPDNFEPFFPQTKGEQQFVLEFKGYRQDCSIRIDAQPAKGLTVDKVYEQNVKKFPKAGAKGETTIDGVKAIYFTYSPVKSVESKVYFLVKQDRMCRIILNYYQPKKKDYLPAFEKVIASLQLK